MCKCRSHGTFPLFGLQSSHLNICYYHQDRTDGRSAQAHAQGFAATAAPSYSSGPGTCPDGRVSAQFGTVTRLPVHPASPVLLTKNGPLGALDSVARLNEAAVPSYLFKSDERFARQYRCGPPPEFPLASPPLRHSSPSFGSRQACSHSKPFSEDQDSLVRVSRRAEWGAHRPVPGARSPFHLSLAGTCLLSVSRRYLALDGIYRPIGAAFPNKPDSQTAPRGATGSGHDGALTLSGAPFQGTWARSAAEDASPDYNSDSEAARFSSWADPGSLAVTKGILVHVHGSFCFAGFDNDPSAGSPTETLLRLLLPLMIRFSGILATSPAANRPRRRDPNTSPDHSIGRSDGRCVQRAGT
ncbi:hypothetical protein L2E82_53313 [Cichorium intybus]|nr:hypothetical protein L2E82_53313 [Cichorium intybus]